MQTNGDQLLGVRLSTQSRLPLYRQLSEALATRIHEGTYPAGFRLPPTRVLAQELGTHRNTIVRAYEDLQAAGFINSTVGRGTFVTDTAVQAVAPRALKPRTAMPWASLLAPAITHEAFARAEQFAHPALSADAIHLNRMQPPDELLPHDLLRRCIDRVLGQLGAKALGYATAGGVARLRELVAEDLARQGVPANADDVLITSGSQQALDMLARALVSAGDTFLVDEATYHGAVRLLAAAGARLVPIPCDDEGPDLDALERLGRGAKGFYLMPNCQNPTGRRISLRRRESLVDWSHRSGVPLLEDDYAADLHLDGKPPLPALRTLDGEVLYLGTYSKKLIPGLRVGYLVAPRTLRPRLELLKHAMDLGGSALMQHALAEFLSRGYLRAHLKKVLPKYRARRDVLDGALRKALPSRYRWAAPETGLALWLPLPDGPDPDAVWKEGQKLGVLIGPGTLNGVSEAGRRGLRVTFCTEAPGRLAEGARRLARAVAAAERRAPAQPERQLEVV